MAPFPALEQRSTRSEATSRGVRHELHGHRPWGVAEVDGGDPKGVTPLILAQRDEVTTDRSEDPSEQPTAILESDAVGRYLNGVASRIKRGWQYTVNYVRWSTGAESFISE